MAGMSVTVCLPGSDDRPVERAVAEALDRFGPSVELEGTWSFLWDSWVIRGGLDEWAFWSAPGHEDDPRLIRTGFSGPGSIQRDWARMPPLPAHCAGGPRSLLDLSDDPACARELAMQTWDVWQDLADRYPQPETMSQIADRNRHKPPHYDELEATKAEFESQPLIHAFKQAHPIGGRDRLAYSDDFVFYPSVLMRHTPADRKSFADAVVRPKPAGSGSLLTLDGWWVEPDGEAYHGACASSSCPHAPHPYAEAVLELGAPEAKQRYIRELPGDVVVVQVHGHC